MKNGKMGSSTPWFTEVMKTTYDFRDDAPFSSRNFRARNIRLVGLPIAMFDCLKVWWHIYIYNIYIYIYPTSQDSWVCLTLILPAKKTTTLDIRQALTGERPELIDFFPELAWLRDAPGLACAGWWEGLKTWELGRTRSDLFGVFFGVFDSSEMMVEDLWNSVTGVCLQLAPCSTILHAVNNTFLAREEWIWFNWQNVWLDMLHSQDRANG